VCAILLGRDPTALVRQLEDRFPQARLTGTDPDFERWMTTAVGLVEQPDLGRDLPLDVQATAFQMRVWQALRGIPPGSTVSYEEIAGRVGWPGSTRSVEAASS
jgi:AraC family transcriptional regulator of adaptative response/methylated-DNA-[protein]-cysteine methyltransferase